MRGLGFKISGLGLGLSGCSRASGPICLLGRNPCRTWDPKGLGLRGHGGRWVGARFPSSTLGLGLYEVHGV